MDIFMEKGLKSGMESSRKHLRDLTTLRIDLSLLDTHKLFAIKKEKDKALSPKITLLPIQQEAFDESHLLDTQLHFLSPEVAEDSIRRLPFSDYAPFTKLPELSIEANNLPVVNNSGKSKKKKWISLVFRVFCTFFIFIFLFKSFSWKTLFSAFGHISYGQILIALVVGFMGVILSAYQWRSILHAEHIRFDLADLVNLYIVGIAFSHFLPTGMGGDAIKALYVGRESGNAAGSASAVVMCRVTGFLSMLLVALPILIVTHTHLAPNLILWFVLLSLIVGGMITTALFFVTILPKLFKGKWTQSRIFVSIMNVGNALSESIKRPRSMIISLIYGAVFWVSAILNCYSYATALSLQVPMYFYFVVVPLISLVAFLPISINGYGLRESAFVYAFATMHVSSANAVLLALLLDVQALLFGVIGGCIYLTMDAKKRDFQQKHIV